MLACFGPNTKQWWVYDEERDCFVDPPWEILEALKKFDQEEQQSRLEKLAEAKPDWLYDEPYCYYDENFEY